MNRFIYRVYYKFDDPSPSNPLRSPKNSHQISEDLRDFPNGLRHYLSDLEAKVSVEPFSEPDSINVLVDTILNETETDDAVKRCLGDFDLYGKKL